MALRVPAPASTWTPAYQIRVNQAVEVADVQNRKKGADVELVNEMLILRSPNGQRWRITVSNAGIVGAVVLP
jgi:hypothetical protein